MRFYSIILALLFLGPVSVVAQEAGEKANNIPQLAFREVNYPFLPSITSDYFYFSSDGLMWFSSAGGLTSFDGTSVLYHNNKTEANELELNSINTITEDENKNLYIGTRTRLIYFDRARKTLSGVNLGFNKSGKPDIYGITSLYYDQQRKLVFVGTNSRGLLVYETASTRFSHFNLNTAQHADWENRTENTVRAIAPHFSDENLLWLGTFQGIQLFNKNTKKITRNFFVTNPVSSVDGTVKKDYEVIQMAVMNDSIIWFNSWSSGLGKYNVRSSAVQMFLNKKVAGFANAVPRQVSPSFCRLGNGYFFIGAHNNQSGIFDPNTGMHYPVNIKEMIVPDDKVTFVSPDRKGNLWLIRNGALVTTMPDFARLQTTDISRQLTPDYNNNELRGICYDSVTKRYYGAVRHSSGVYVFDSSFKLLEIIPTPLYTNRYTLNETCTDKITIDGSGRIWVTGHETYILMPGRKKFDYIRNVLPSLAWLEKKGEFYFMLSNREGDIMMQGDNANLYVINHKSLETDTAAIVKFDYEGNYVNTNSPLLYDAVRSLVYYSNNYGTIQYDLKKKKRNIISPDAFLGPDRSGRPLVKFSLDDLGRIWVLRVNQGIRIIDPQTLKCVDSFPIGSRGLLPENYTYISGGGKDYMILEGNSGIVVYNYTTRHSLMFNHTNGLKHVRPYAIMYCKNHLVLGLSNAVQYYRIPDFVKNNFTLKPRVNNVHADTVIVYEPGLNDEDREIRIKYSRNSIRFSFSVPEYVFPERVEYAYQLFGYDNEWHFATYFRREVAYSRLPPGKYVFSLKARLQGGNWDINPVNYTLIIEPAFWQTIGFKVLLMLLVLAGLFLGLQLRIRVIRKQEREKAGYEKQFLELEAKALRAQMNPHFIFNCMNSIKSLIQEDQREKAVVYLTTFSKLIRFLFNNADKKEISLYDELETCRLYLQLEAMRFGVQFQYEIEIDEGIDLKSVFIPALIIQPFIENAIWHGIIPKGSGGKLSLVIKRKNDQVEIIIDDDGIGRQVSLQNKSISNIAHQSKGVNLTQARIELDNLLRQQEAGIEVIDKHDSLGSAAGTKVIITLKIPE